MNKKRLIVIGGGAAGFFCAVNAARLNPNLEVQVIEKTGKLLSKVKVSGGGRCNVTNASDSIADVIRRYPRGAAFLKKAFHHFFTTDTIQWFNSRGVALKAEPDGRMFPVTDDSSTIMQCLLKEAGKYEVQILMNRQVEAIRIPAAATGHRFEIVFANGKTEHADFICVATGGHARATAYQWIQSLGHTIEAPLPSLFTFNMPGNAITALMGITVEDVTVKISGTKLSERGPLLITHWGMSGPAVLKLSAWGARELAARNYEFTIHVNWLPFFNEQTLREKFGELRFSIASQKMQNRNPFGLPARLWEYQLQQAGIGETTRWADLAAAAQNKLIRNLCGQEFAVRGKTGFKEEFVTSGGVLLSEIDHNTMQSKKIPGLYFAGEVIDADGVTGGFNFQQAWTTGWIAARAIASSV